MISYHNQTDPIVASCPINKGHPLAQGMTAFWYSVPQQAGGDWFDLVSGLKAHIRTTSGPSRSPSTMPGHSSDFSFSGANQIRLDIGIVPQLALTGEVTTLACVNSPNWTSPAAPYVFGDAIGQWAYGTSSSKLRCVWNNAAFGTGATTLSANRWYMLGGVRYGSTGSWHAESWVGDYQTNVLKLDGSGSTATNPLAVTANGYCIGHDGDDSLTSTYFNGHIASVAVWTRRLLAPEIGWWYANAPRGFPGLINRISSALFAIQAAASEVELMESRIMIAGNLCGV